MGYLCPVCGEPFGGAAPLTDHLAVSAILHGGDHEAWLADAVDDADDWASIPRAELADAIADRAAETDDDHDHPGEAHAGHDHPIRHTEQPSPDRLGADLLGSEVNRHGAGEDRLAPEADRLDADATAILREAQALTQAMQAGAGAGDTADGDENDATENSETDTAENSENDVAGYGDQNDAADDTPEPDGDDERKES